MYLLSVYYFDERQRGGGVTTIRGRAIDDTGTVRDTFEHPLP